jgi:murein tripeptide amidase MpaA
MDQLDQRVIPEVMWVIIPMFNIDGVFMGNNRTGLIGEDYNRNWNFE